MLCCTRVLAVTAIIAILGARGADGAKQDPSRPTRRSIEVTAHPRNSRGRLGCLLFASGDGFPQDASRARQALWARIVRRKATCRFVDLPKGHYAVAILHDENGNGKMDTSWIGVPKEGYGVSRDAPPRAFSGPPYEKARFHFDGSRLAMTLRLRY